MSWGKISSSAIKLAIFTHTDAVFLFVNMELNGINCFPTLSHVSVTDPTVHATTHGCHYVKREIATRYAPSGKMAAVVFHVIQEKAYLAAKSTYCIFYFILSYSLNIADALYMIKKYTQKCSYFYFIYLFTFYFTF